MVGIRRAIPLPCFLVLLLSLLLLFIIVVRLLLDSYRPGGLCCCLLPFISSLFCFILVSTDVLQCGHQLRPTSIILFLPFRFDRATSRTSELLVAGLPFKSPFPSTFTSSTPPHHSHSLHCWFACHALLHEFLVPCLLPTK